MSSNTVNVSTTTNQVVITPQSTKTVSVNSGDNTSITVNKGASNTITVSDNVVNTSLTPTTVGINIPPSNGITVTDLRKTITVNQGITSIVNVNTVGPQGPKGDTGPQGPSGSVQDTGSLLITASYSNPNLTFTKGNGDTFNVEIETTPIDTGSFLITASNVGVGDRVYFTKGDGSQFILTIDNVANATSASYILATNVEQPFTSITASNISASGEIISNTLTSSLTENYIWVGNSNNQNTEIPISSLPGYFPFNYGLFAQTGSSTPVTGITAGSLIDGGAGTLSVPANGFQVGDSFRVVMAGVCTFQNNDILAIRINGGKTGTTLLTSTGPITLANATGTRWRMQIDFTVYAIGKTGTASILSAGQFFYTKDASTDFVGVNFSDENNTTFTTTISNKLDITAQFNNTGNSIYSKLFVLNKTF